MTRESVGTDDELPIFIPIDACLPRLFSVLSHRDIMAVVEYVMDCLGDQVRP